MSAHALHRSPALPDSLHLRWNQSQDGRWCDLDRLNLEHAHFDRMEGVYVIWYGGPNGRVVAVGQGAIRERLKAHRADPRLESYRPLNLIVSWAVVSADLRAGVERFLAESYRPLVSDGIPDHGVLPVAVNLIGD